MPATGACGIPGRAPGRDAGDDGPGRGKGGWCWSTGGVASGLARRPPLYNGITALALGREFDGEAGRWSRKALFIGLALLPIAFLVSIVWAWWHRGAIRAKSGVAGLFSLWFPLAPTLWGWWSSSSAFSRALRPSDRHLAALPARLRPASDCHGAHRGGVGGVQAWGGMQWQGAEGEKLRNEPTAACRTPRGVVRADRVLCGSRWSLPPPWGIDDPECVQPGIEEAALRITACR